MVCGSSVGCCPVPRLALVYLPLQCASNTSGTPMIPTYPPLHRAVFKQAPRQGERYRNLYSLMGHARTQDPDLLQEPSYSPAHENSLALAQAVTNVQSLLPGRWSVRSHPVPRLWGGGTGAVCTHTPIDPISTLLPLPRHFGSPHFDLGEDRPEKWPLTPALPPSEDKMLAEDQRKFKIPKSHCQKALG